MRAFDLTITFIIVLLCGPFNAANAQKVMEYELCSPDTIKYSISQVKMANHEQHVSIDLGYFNYNDTPEVHIWVKPAGMPFIVDEAVWTIAYLKPIINKRKRIDIGTWGEIICYRYKTNTIKYFRHTLQKSKKHIAAMAIFTLTLVVPTCLNISTFITTLLSIQIKRTVLLLRIRELLG